MNTRSMSIRQTLLALAVTLLAAAACMGLTLQTAYADETATALPEPVDGVITLTQDVNLTDTAVIETDTTLDLAGYTVNGYNGTNGGRAIRIDNGKLTIADSSEDKDGAIVLPENSGGIAIIVNGGELDMQAGDIFVSGQDAAGIRVQAKGTAVMNSGNIEAEGVGAMGVAVMDYDKSPFEIKDGTIHVSGQGCMGIYAAGEGQEVTVSGGIISVDGADSYGINTVTMGSFGHEINISGGNVTAKGNRAYAVNLESLNQLKVTGGSLNSADSHAVVYFGGNNTGTISGGAIKGKTYGVYIINAATSKLTVSGSPVISGETGSVYAGRDRNKTSASVQISSGYFNGKIADGIPSEKTYKYSDYDITGGYFTDEIEDSALYNFVSAKGYTPETYTDEVKAGETNIMFPIKKTVEQVTYNYTVRPKESYVLMNIPYADFYAEELGDGAEAVDAVTSATLNKPRTGTLAGGSYHVNADGSDISGVIYPVYVSDMSLLEGKTEITDESSVDITVTNRGTTTTTTYSGKDALFESASYSYYVLNEIPSHYKELTADENGFTFGAVQGETRAVEGAAGEVTVGARHADIEIKLSGTEGIAQGDTVSGVILTDNENKTYGLRHVANVWRGTEIGWNLSEFDLGGKTIKNIRYITQNAVIDYPVDIAISDAGYVLMNIPYADFYAAELGEGAASVDAVTSATKMKPRTGTLAGGSYHVDPEGTDISGVIYPVFVSDTSVLEGCKQISDEDSVEITVTNRGKEATTTYSGKDALFESASYSYYALTEKPARYKTLTVNDGKFSFSAVSGRATTVEGATGEIEYKSHHNNDVEITLSNTTGIELGQAVSGVIVTGEDGTKEALRHIAEIWRGTYIGWADAANWYGKTITNIRYITQDTVIDFPVAIKIKNDPGDVTAAFTDLETIGLTGLPADIENPKATVQTVVGRGETPVVIAESVDVTNGTIKLNTAAANSTAYMIRIVSDNYADISVEATSPEESSSGGTSGGGTTPAPSETDQAKAALTNAITDAKTIAADGYTAESYKALTDAIAAAEKIAADPNATADQLKAAADAIASAKAGLVQAAAEESEYTITAEATDEGAGTAALTNPKDAAKYTIPKTVVLADGKTYKVTAIGAGAFAGKQTKKVIIGANVKKIEQGAFDQSGVTRLIVKTKKLKKAFVRGSLKGSSVKVIKVKVGKKKVNKKYVKKYKKIFTAKNAGKKVKVK